MFNMFAGGAVGRMAIFALGIMPYISASIIMQLMTSVVPTLEQLKKEGEQGRKIINQYTRYGTVVLAVLQAYGIAVGLEGGTASSSIPGCSSADDGHHADRRHHVPDVARRADHRRGIGNGISLIIFAGIVADLPHALVGTLELGRTGALSTR